MLIQKIVIRKSATIRRRRRRSQYSRGNQLNSSPGKTRDVEIANKKTELPNAGYSKQTTRPIVCLAFVLPLLILYEFGSIFADKLSGKSGIDQWLHRMMDSIGIGHLVILPLLTAGALLCWHHHTNDHWKFRPTVLLGMLVESCCLGIILFFAGNAVFQIISVNVEIPVLAIPGNPTINWWSATIAYIGCGVYEELIFRLLLLNGLIVAGRKYCREKEAKLFGMLLTSLLFAALHYNFFNPAGADFELGSFMFRFSASLVFCVLFLFRGFGIVVGTHCLYDVMTQL